MTQNEFEYFLFYSKLELVLEGIDAGVSGVIVDLESKGKVDRQSLYNTQINEHSIADVKKVRLATPSRIICRVNGGKFLDRNEILAAIDAGADEILIPMVTSLEEIDRVSEWINDQARLALMIETSEAIQLVKEINQYPIFRVFVGLNDLSISQNQRNLFLPLVDGTVEHIRNHITTRFGIAGLTHPSSGNPVSCKMLINEMKRLRCTFGFLRRSYYADLKEYSQKEIMRALREEFSNSEINSSLSLDLRNYVMDSRDPLLLKTI